MYIYKWVSHVDIISRDHEFIGYECEDPESENLSLWVLGDWCTWEQGINTASWRVPRTWQTRELRECGPDSVTSTRERRREEGTVNVPSSRRNLTVPLGRYRSWSTLTRVFVESQLVFSCYFIEELFHI